MTEQPPSDPKIIVDEDWKSQAQAEKETLQKQREEKQREEKQREEKQREEQNAEAAEQQTEPEKSSQPSEAQTDASAKTAADAAAEPEMPPASFPMLLTTLATQALAALGQLADPAEGKPVVRLPVARHFIDTLDLLEQKTKGNLTPDEATMLSGMLHELRMAFVAAQTGPSKQATTQ